MENEAKTINLIAVVFMVVLTKYKFNIKIILLKRKKTLSGCPGERLCYGFFTEIPVPI
jgi:hypothetical protein